MRRSKENNPGSIAAPNGQDGQMMGGIKMIKGMEQNQRRALSSINQNTIRILSSPLWFGFIFISSVLDRKDEVCNKKSALEERQDNTRSLAVERASNQDHFLEDTKNQTRFTVKPGGLDDIEIDNSEEWKDDNDDAVPSFVKNTEAVLDETDRMDIEMEDMEESIVDIDCSDSNNPLAASSRVSPNYMDRQFDINEKMKAILFDWLIEVSVPIVEDFVLISDKAYTRKDVLDMLLQQFTQPSAVFGGSRPRLRPDAHASYDACPQETQGSAEKV
ncbi:Cyclin b2,4 isoform 2 [Hibiscus syriacus]|uniref:Cyclin b2,4 isoform 2 n=1 Tax=Hibiscus syriacus TaxID=106335 RepID=A0A6A3BQA3_HIBSY|nr:Cyclin b2,4 isoform 2 [Hibiscus syriacus]